MKYQQQSLLDDQEVGDKALTSRGVAPADKVAIKREQTRLRNVKYRARQATEDRDKKSSAIGYRLPKDVELKEVSSTYIDIKEDPGQCVTKTSRKQRQKPKTKTDLKKNGVISVIGVIPSNGADSRGNKNELVGVIGVISKGITLDDSVNPLHESKDAAIEHLSFDALPPLSFIVKDDWFFLDGKRKPGVWFVTERNGEKIAERVCSPLHVIGVTNTENGGFFGRLLKFRDTLGRWHEWAMPMELLRGSGEELRDELLAAGVEIEPRNRNRLVDYLQWRTPREVITSAIKTGWTANGGAFVLHDGVIGNERVHFQGESISVNGSAGCGGDYLRWQSIAKCCDDNPVLQVSLCVALSGSLLAKVHQDSGGIHWLGDSSIGKTTALCVGASVWGGDDFKRTWRATSNGLEGVAALLSDTCLCLDEISEADPKEVGAIVYSLGNGTGKTRATRIGSARNTQRWRLSLLSTGERSISAAMQEGGKRAKAGQLVRLLNIDAARSYGAFDNLHHFDSGRAMADYFKAECSRHYGHAGVKFVEYLH
jgi:putative DNA primase/helicase